MKKWIWRLFLYGTPLALIVKATLFTEGQTNTTLLVAGILWIVFASQFHSGSAQADTEFSLMKHAQSDAKKSDSNAS